MSQKSNILHKALLKNNCPTCFGIDGLELTFIQGEKENAFFHKPDSTIGESLYCHNCKNPIYPVNWTEDIERVYNYHKKLSETKRQHLRIKPLFYILIIAAIIVSTAVGYILLL